MAMSHRGLSSGMRELTVIAILISKLSLRGSAGIAREAADWKTRRPLHRPFCFCGNVVLVGNNKRWHAHPKTWESAQSRMRAGMNIITDKHFNEQFYLAAYADVRKAVAEGVLSTGREHYDKFGKAEGRLGSLPNLTEVTYKPKAPVGVTAKLHPEDFILHFILNVNKDKTTAVEQYYANGRSSAQCLRDVLAEDTTIDPNSKFQLLEFASGYGCVTRHLAESLPNATITSCDIHPQAMKFIADEMKVDTVLSKSEPELFKLGRQFDLVFALSFFTHMPDRTYGPWMEALFQHVRPGGYLIFTTAGDRGIAQTPNASISDDGYGFIPQSEQGDLDIAEYGSTFSTPFYVTRRIYRLLKAPLVSLRTGYWWAVQDTYVVKRPVPWPHARFANFSESVQKGRTPPGPG
jgi:SAM-dependent methyltransferase